MRQSIIALTALLTLSANSVGQEVTDRHYWCAAIGYEATHVAFEYDEPSRVLQGISASCTYGLIFSKVVPVGMETGARLAWSHKEKESGALTKTDLLSLSVPVDFMYRFRMFNATLGVAPFTGPNFRFNLVGQRKTLINPQREYYKVIDLLADEAYSPANVFQLGWRLGVNFYWHRLCLGYGFTYDLNLYTDEARSDYGVRNAGEVKTSSHSVTVGFTF